MTESVAGTWRIERFNDLVKVLHGLGTPEPAERTLRWCEPTRPCLALGSAQKESDVDVEVAEALGVDIVRRRSGGGAVLVEPGDLIWVDLFIPATDPLWCADVGKAFAWVGALWRDVLVDLGYKMASVHEGALVSNEWSRQACFAGLGPGEVTIGNRKVVGISQKRTREGALFQCALLRRFDASKLARLLKFQDSTMSRTFEYEIGLMTLGLPIQSLNLESTLTRYLADL